MKGFKARRFVFKLITKLLSIKGKPVEFIRSQFLLKFHLLHINKMFPMRYTPDKKRN